MGVENSEAESLVNTLLPDVSVVMAVHIGVNYNHLVLAADSIIEQTKSNFEFIVVCDGALTTQQESYLVSLQKKHVFVIIIRLDINVGPGAARNTGIKKAKGKYIAVMDSDDIALPNRLKRQFDYLEEHDDIAVVGCFCDVIDDDGVVVGARKLPLSPESLRTYTLFFCPLNNPTVMGRRKILSIYMYDEKLRQGEDYRLWVKLLSVNLKLSNIGKPLVQFRVSDDLYKRRSGSHKAYSDFINRLYAMRIAPFYLKPFVLVFAFLSFTSRFFPVKVIRIITLSLELFRKKIFIG